MSKKKSNKLSEEDREVGLHLFRFAKFLRYLKENKAVIKATDPNSGRQVTYRYDNTSSGSSLKNLVTVALEIDDDYAYDLLTRKLTSSDTQSNKERMRGDGDMLYGITVHKTVSDDPDDPQIPINSINYQYYHRKSYLKPPRFDLSTTITETNNERDKRREFTIDHELQEVLRNYINASIEGFVLDDDFAGRMTGVDFVQFPVFESQILQLKEILNEEKEKKDEGKSNQSVEHKLLKLARVYNQVLERHNIQNSIIPYYRDFAVLSEDGFIDESIKLHFDNNPEEFLEGAKSFLPEDLIYFRYEILYKQIAKQENVREWPTQFQALLMFCNYELEGMHVLLRELINNELSRMRYTVLTKDSYKDGRYQQSNLSSNQLHDVLKEYDINEPVENIFDLSGNHIMSTELYKYPEKYAVDYNYSRSEIQVMLSRILKDFISTRLFENLNMDEKLLPKDPESAILL